MVPFKISDEQWPVVKLKLLRKYRDLSEADLAYQEGQEEELVNRLARRLNRNREYAIFTISKGLSDLKSNQL